MGKTTKRIVVQAARENGWTHDNGDWAAAMERNEVDMRRGLRRVSVHFGVRGQITWAGHRHPRERKGMWIVITGTDRLGQVTAILTGEESAGD